MYNKVFDVPFIIFINLKWGWSSGKSIKYIHMPHIIRTMQEGWIFSLLIANNSPAVKYVAHFLTENYATEIIWNETHLCSNWNFPNEKRNLSYIFCSLRSVLLRNRWFFSSNIFIRCAIVVRASSMAFNNNTWLISINLVFV